MIRTLIVDDERLARTRLKTLLASDTEIDVVGEAANADDAVAAIRKQKPELVLLDIEMPGDDGFAVLRRIRGERMPAVIFITAHNEYAVRAFEVQAIDYVLKPFDRRRFAEAIDRAKKRVANGGDDAEKRILQLLEQLTGSRAEPKRLEHFVVKSRDRTFLVPVSDVEWIGAEGKYVRLHTRDAAFLVREAIGDVEQRLDSRKFLRIHRATIVNIKRIAEMHRGFGGSVFVLLRDGTKLTMSRRYRTRIREIAGLDV